MSFEVDRPIQLLGSDSSDLIKADINHALTGNAISTTDLTHAASPTYSTASSSFSSAHGGSTTTTTTTNGLITGYSDKQPTPAPTVEDPSPAMRYNHNIDTSTTTVSTSITATTDCTPQQTYDNNSASNNKHLLSPVPDCLDGDSAAVAADAAAAAAAAVNSGGEAPARVPLPTPPASDGTPPHRQWHDSIRRPFTNVVGGGNAATTMGGNIRSLPYSPVHTTTTSSWQHHTPTCPSSSVMAPPPHPAAVSGAGAYPGPGFVSSFSGSSSIMPTSSHPPADAMYHGLIQQGSLPHPQHHIGWMQQEHDPYRPQHHYYSDPFVSGQHSPIPSSYHQQFEPPPPQPTSMTTTAPRRSYHPYQHSHDHHNHQHQHQHQHRHHHHHSHHTQQQLHLTHPPNHLHQHHRHQPSEKPPPQQPSLSASSSDSSSSTANNNNNNMMDAKVVTTTPRRYKCTVCVKRFTRPSSLATHMHSHTGEKPYKCQIEGCGRRFSVVSNLRRHAKIHNNTNNSSDLTKNSLNSIKSS